MKDDWSVSMEQGSGPEDVILNNNVGGFQSFWVKADIDGNMFGLSSLAQFYSKSLCLQTCTK